MDVSFESLGSGAITGWAVALATVKVALASNAQHIAGLHKRIETLEGDNQKCLERYDFLVQEFLNFKKGDAHG